MTDYGTIKIPKAEYDRHNERRKEMNLSWAEYIDGEAPDLPNGSEVDTESLVSDLKAQLPSAVADEVESRLR